MLVLDECDGVDYDVYVFGDDYVYAQNDENAYDFHDENAYDHGGDHACVLGGAYGYAYENRSENAYGLDGVCGGVRLCEYVCARTDGRAYAESHVCVRVGHSGRDYDRDRAYASADACARVLAYGCACADVCVDGNEPRHAVLPLCEIFRNLTHRKVQLLCGNHWW